MATSLTARNLFDDLKKKLNLHWVGGIGDSAEYFISAGDLTARPSLAGFLNLIHPNKVQVLGEEETQFLDSLESTELRQTVEVVVRQPAPNATLRLRMCAWHQPRVPAILSNL